MCIYTHDIRLGLHFINPCTAAAAARASQDAPAAALASSQGRGVLKISDLPLVAPTEVVSLHLHVYMVTRAEIHAAMVQYYLRIYECVKGEGVGRVVWVLVKIHGVCAERLVDIDTREMHARRKQHEDDS